MIDMESSARGFELTGDERFLKTFQSAESQLPASVDALTQLTSDNPAQQARVRDIRQLDENWVRWAEREIASRPNKKPTEDELMQGDALMEQITKQPAGRSSPRKNDCSTYAPAGPPT